MEGRMKKFFKVATAAVLAVFITNNSIADNEGLSVGVWGSSFDLDTYGSETQGNVDGTLDIVSATSSKSKDMGGIFVEYTAAQGSSFGIEYVPGTATLGSGSRTDTMNDADDGSTTSATYTASADVKHLTTFYIEPTLMVNDTFGVYGKLGLTTMHVTSIESLSFGTDSTSYPNTNVYGGTYGLGVKARHSSGIFLKLEGSVTNFAPIELQGTGGNTGSKIQADIDVEAVRLAIGYTF